MDEEKALNFLLKEADEAEIYYSNEKSNSVSIRGGEIEIYEGSNISGYGIRIIKNKQTGFVYSNILDKDTLLKAFEIARISEKDNHISLPERKKFSRVKGVYDEDISSLEVEDVLKFINKLMGPCKEYNVHPASGSINWSIFKVRVLNSHGINVQEKGTICSSYLNTVAKGQEVSTGMEYTSSRNLDLDFEYIGEASSKLAKESMNANKIGNLETNLELKPHAVSELIGSVLIPSFNADNVLRGRSYLGDKLNKKVFSDFSIIDNGKIPNGLNTSKFDSEGSPTQKTPLINNGIVEGFLYDTYSGNKAQTSSTGNSQRSSYSSPPQINSSNLILSGDGRIEGDGLVVNGLIGAHTSNPVSGDFSLETRNAFYQSKPVKKAMISGNVYELFNEINGFGKDVKQTGNVITPTIEFSNVKIVGS